MAGWGWVLFWWLAFAGSHMVLSSNGVRPLLVGRLGEKAFQGFYSLIALATFVPLVITYGSNKHAGPLLWNLPSVPGIRTLAMVLATLAWAIIVAAIVQPSPMSLDPRSSPKPQGLTRITRHPLFMGVALWGLSHCLLFGFMSDVIFFGGFLLFGILGSAHQDVRMRVTQPRLAPFYQGTSFVPFAAILGGRNRLVFGDLPWRGFAIGVGVAAVLYLVHPWLFY